MERYKSNAQKFREIPDEDIQKMINSKETLVSICDRYGISPMTLYNNIRDRGLKYRSRFESNAAKLKDIKDHEFIRMINNGVKLSEMAERYKVSTTRVNVEINSRDLFNPSKVEGRRTLPLKNPVEKGKYDSDIYRRSEDDVVSTDSWMNSPERKAYVNAGLMSNKSLRRKY